MLNLQSVRPHPALRPFIRSFVQRDADLGALEIVEPVVARVGVTLELKFAGLYEIRGYTSNSLIRPNRISVVGPQTWRRVHLTLRSRIESLTVMFQPCGFHALFGTPTCSLADISTEGHSVLGTTLSRLYERLGNLRTFPERTELLNCYFWQCLQSAPGIDPAYDALHLLTEDGQFKVSDAAHQAGLSCRQLERKALMCAGVSPKVLTRIARFTRALQLSKESSLNWTEIAHAAEYHDHMHLIRDFRAFAGQTPTWTLQAIAPFHLVNFSACDSATQRSGTCGSARNSMGTS